MYLALGDAISMDLYPGVPAGGAAGQLARRLDVREFVDLTYDGCSSQGALNALQRAPERADVVTITVGGYDILSAYSHAHRGAEAGIALLAENLTVLADELAKRARIVVLNTIYDTTDGDDSHSDELGIPATARDGLTFTNAHIRTLARERGLLLADLHAIFWGHGFWSPDPWLVEQVEPNLKGATAIADEWERLVRASL